MVSQRGEPGPVWCLSGGHTLGDLVGSLHSQDPQQAPPGQSSGVIYVFKCTNVKNFADQYRQLQLALIPIFSVYVYVR